jgi:hypothetical protein
MQKEITPRREKRTTLYHVCFIVLPSMLRIILYPTPIGLSYSDRPMEIIQKI